MINLNEWFEKGNIWLYNTLTDLYQEAYEPGTELHFILTKEDKYYELISTFDRYISYIDISPYFIYLHTNDQRITDKPYTIIYTYPELTLAEQPEVNCVLPYIHFYTEPNGDILPCCNADRKYPITNIKYVNTLDDIMYHENMEKLRNNMRYNIPSKECNYCYEREDKNLSSLRIESNEFFKTTPDFVTLKKIDLRSSNICNLKCRMCSGKFSSRIAKEEHEIWNVPLPTTITDHDNNKLFNLIKENIKDVEYIYFAGGEPLLMKDHYELLDILIANNKTDIPIEYNTNMTILKYKNINVIDYWKSFNDITLGCSIDAMGSRAEYQRNGTKWDDIVNNIKEISKTANHIKINITSILTVYNSFHLMDLQRFLIEEMHLPLENITFKISSEPDFLNISILPANLRKKVIESIEKHILYLQPIENSKKICNSWKNVVEYLNTVDNTFLIGKFKKHNMELDKHRNENFVSVYPELKELYDQDQKSNDKELHEYRERNSGS